VSSNRFDPLDENEREWLRSSRRQRKRRTWVMLAAAAVVIGVLVWLLVVLLSGGRGGGARTPVGTSAQDRLLADSRRALQDWGRFGVSGDLNTVKASFWAEGPQYRQLAQEAPRLQQHPIGPPPYQFVLEDNVQILPAGTDRIVRGVIKTSRQGQPTLTFHWDIYMRQDRGAGGRWRIWTVANTPRR